MPLVPGCVPVRRLTPSRLAGVCRRDARRLRGRRTGVPPVPTQKRGLLL
ncbi:MAG: hypothetical protein KME26_14750 [Oscillatoria princeps RMCB-10]|nr:hypothetical protein [Oscillatoria princeps RMCB-10]